MSESTDAPGASATGTDMAWEEGTAKGSGGQRGVTLWLILAVAVVVAVGVATGMTLLSMNEDASTSAAPQPIAQADAALDPIPTNAAPLDAAATAVSPSDAAARADSEPAAAEAVVTITLEDVPDGANVFYDGAGVDGTVLRVPRAELMRELRVEHNDGRSWRHMITPNQDRTYAVVFDDPAPSKRPRPKRGLGGVRLTRPTEVGTPAAVPTAPATKAGPGGAFNPVFE